MKLKCGITLIALIITIIVLLILAGVSLNLTLGKRGIFKISKEASKNYMNAQEKELEDLEKLEEELNHQYDLPYEGKGYKFIYDGSLKSVGIDGENVQKELTGGWSTARVAVSCDKGATYRMVFRIFIYK